MMERGLKHQQIWNDGVAVAGSYRPQVYIICMWRIQLQKCIVGDALSLDAPIAVDFTWTLRWEIKIQPAEQEEKDRN